MQRCELSSDCMSAQRPPFWSVYCFSARSVYCFSAARLFNSKLDGKSVPIVLVPLIQAQHRERIAEFIEAGSFAVVLWKGLKDTKNTHHTRGSSRPRLQTSPPRSDATMKWRDARSPRRTVGSRETGVLQRSRSTFLG